MAHNRNPIKGLLWVGISLTIVLIAVTIYVNRDKVGSSDDDSTDSRTTADA